MKKIFNRHMECWKEKKSIYAIFSGAGLLFVSLVVNHFANAYTNLRASNSLTDIILDNIPTIDVGEFLNYGVMIFSAFIILFLFTEPKKIPFFLKSFSLFILIRSVFITLTHLGPVPLMSIVNPNDMLSSLISGNDYFFSGHTGMPFLIALIFWKNKLIRYVSLAASLIFGTSVLLGHLHYSIDVFAAFFITYTIFHISQRIFSKDYEVFRVEDKFRYGKT